MTTLTASCTSTRNPYAGRDFDFFLLIVDFCCVEKSRVACSVHFGARPSEWVVLKFVDQCLVVFCVGLAVCSHGFPHHHHGEEAVL